MNQHRDAETHRHRGEVFDFRLPICDWNEDRRGESAIANRKSQILSLRLCISVSLCLCVLCSRPSRAAEKQRFAVVDVSFVFEKYKKVAEVSRSIDESIRARKTELDKRGEELGKREQEMQQFMKDSKPSESVFDAVQKLRKDQYLFERDVDRLNEQMQKDYAREMGEVLSDIRFAIKKYAEEQHFQAVFRSPYADDPDVEPSDPKKLPDPAAGDKKTYLALTEPQNIIELMERFRRNPILFGGGATDITQAILDRLNADYIKRQAPGK